MTLRFPSRVTYFENVKERGPEPAQVLAHAIPLWRAGLDTDAITRRLNDEYGWLLHPALVANEIARWRDGRARAA